MIKRFFQRILCVLIGHTAIDTQQVHSRASVFLGSKDSGSWHQEEFCERCGVSFLIYR